MAKKKNFIHIYKERKFINLYIYKMIEIDIFHA